MFDDFELRKLTEQDVRSMLLGAVPGETIDFSNCDFTDCNKKAVRDIFIQFNNTGVLDNISFDSSDLSGMDFGGVSLRNTSFKHSTLIDANFDHASFDYCSFYRTDCSGAMFKDSDVQNSDFVECWLRESIFDGANFYNVTIDSPIPDNASFADAGFEYVTIKGGLFQGVNFCDARFDSSVITKTDIMPKYTMFMKPEFWSDTDFDNVRLNNCVISDAGFRNIVASNMNIYASSFENSDFDGILLVGSSLSEVTLNNDTFIKDFGLMSCYVHNLDFDSCWYFGETDAAVYNLLEHSSVKQCLVNGIQDLIDNSKEEPKQMIVAIEDSKIQNDAFEFGE